MSNIDKAAEIISQETREFGRSVNRAYDRALLAARKLADAGLLADDPPGPSFYAHEIPDKPVWDTVNHFRTDALDAPKVALSKAGNAWKMTPADARALAQALLAAADHAEKEAQ